MLRSAKSNVFSVNMWKCTSHYCTRIAVSAIKFLRITRESRNAVISLVNSVFIYRLRQIQNLNFKFTQLPPVTITLLISRLSNYYVPQNVFDLFRSISPFPENV